MLRSVSCARRLHMAILIWWLLTRQMMFREHTRSTAHPSAASWTTTSRHSPIPHVRSMPFNPAAVRICCLFVLLSARCVGAAVQLFAGQEAETDDGARADRQRH